MQIVSVTMPFLVQSCLPRSHQSQTPFAPSHPVALLLEQIRNIQCNYISIEVILIFPLHWSFQRLPPPSILLKLFSPALFLKQKNQIILCALQQFELPCLKPGFGQSSSYAFQMQAQGRQKCIRPCNKMWKGELKHKVSVYRYHSEQLSNSEPAVEFSSTSLVTLCCQAIGKHHWHSSTTPALLMNVFTFGSFTHEKLLLLAQDSVLACVG